MINVESIADSSEIDDRFETEKSSGDASKPGNGTGDNGGIENYQKGVAEAAGIVSADNPCKGQHADCESDDSHPCIYLAQTTHSDCARGALNAGNQPARRQRVQTARRE